MAILIFLSGAMIATKATRNIIMEEAFEQGYAVPVKTSEGVKYEWANTTLIGNPPALEQN